MGFISSNVNGWNVGKENMWKQGSGDDQCLKNNMYITHKLTLDVMLCNCHTHHTYQIITSHKISPTTSQFNNTKHNYP